VTAWNLGAERLLGHSAEAMLGHGLERILPPEQLWPQQDGVECLGGGATPRQVGGTSEVQTPRPVGGTSEMAAVHADGRRLTVELSLSGWSEHGRNGFTAVLRDVTARRRAELLAELVRSAASTANSAAGFPDGARTVLADVCRRLGWVAGRAWTADDRTAVWALGPHLHEPGARCRLESLAVVGDAPSAEQPPFDEQTRIIPAEALFGTVLGPAWCPAASAAGSPWPCWSAGRRSACWPATSRTERRLRTPPRWACSSRSARCSAGSSSGTGAPPCSGTRPSTTR
jgi:PAS domain S-box-containing protein